MKNREPHWYLDALDARAGLGFTSLRSASPVGRERDAPSVFLSAPEFRPIYLANRGVGLAAARHTLQVGLFLKDEEVPFPTLEDVSEFLRRCYVRGGRGDGGGRPAGGGPPEPPPEPFDVGDWGPAWPPELSETKAWTSDEYGSGFGAFTAAVKRAGANDLAGQGLDVIWPSSNEGSGEERGAKSLTLGAIEVLKEVLARLPVAAPPLQEWETSAMHLGCCIARLGLANTLAIGRDRATPDPSNLKARLEPYTGKLEAGESALSYVLGLPDRLGPWILYGTNYGTDPLDLLDSLPVPRSVWKALGNVDAKRASLNDFLAAFLAAPTENPAPILHVALFCAACITSSTEALGTAVDARRRFALRRVGRIAAHAKRWLERQLPRRAFGPSLESFIQNAGSPMKSNSMSAV